MSDSEVSQTANRLAPTVRGARPEEYINGSEPFFRLRLLLRAGGRATIALANRFLPDSFEDQEVLPCVVEVSR
jgi:hypothetical protein